MDFSEKEMTNPKIISFKFIQPLITFLGKVLGIVRYFLFHPWCFTQENLPQTPTYNVIP
jgi:hypothetical protein